MIESQILNVCFLTPTHNAELGLVCDWKIKTKERTDCYNGTVVSSTVTT